MVALPAGTLTSTFSSALDSENMGEKELNIEERERKGLNSSYSTPKGV